MVRERKVKINFADGSSETGGFNPHEDIKDINVENHKFTIETKDKEEFESKKFRRKIDSVEVERFDWE